MATVLASLPLVAVLASGLEEYLGEQEVKNIAGRFAGVRAYPLPLPHLPVQFSVCITAVHKRSVASIIRTGVDPISLLITEV